MEALVNILETVAELFVRASTRYFIKGDRIIIWRAGAVFMDIPYSDIDLIEYVGRWSWSSIKFMQEEAYRLAIPSLRVLRLQIRKASGFQYVLIDPREPDHVIKTWYLARYPAEALAQGWRSPQEAQPRSSN